MPAKPVVIRFRPENTFACAAFVSRRARHGGRGASCERGLSLVRNVGPVEGTMKGLPASDREEDCRGAEYG